MDIDTKSKEWSWLNDSLKETEKMYKKLAKERDKKSKLARIKTWMPSKNKRKKYYQKHGYKIQNKL